MGRSNAGLRTFFILNISVLRHQMPEFHILRIQSLVYWIYPVIQLPSGTDISSKEMSHLTQVMAKTNKYAFYFIRT